MNHNPYSAPSAAVVDVEQVVDLVRPRNATIGIRTFWTLAIVGLIGGGFSLFAMEMPAGVSRPVVLAVAACFVAIFVGLYFWVLRAAGRGRNWGRITLTVLMALGALGVFISPEAGGGSQLQRAVYFVQLVIELIALGLLYTPTSNAWYSAVRRALSH